MADRTQLAGLLSGEIGGANGMVPLFVGAALDMPVLDGDSIGRAFPRIDLSLPYVYGVTEPFPAAVADPRGISYLIAQMDTPRRFEDVVRALTTELGLCAAFAGTLTGHAVREYTCHRTVSQTWFIGRAIQMARLEKTSLLSKLEAEIPGCRSIFSGRVVNVIRGVQGGWTIGTATVEPAGDDESEDSSDIATAKAGSRPLFVEYQVCCCLFPPYSVPVLPFSHSTVLTSSRTNTTTPPWSTPTARTSLSAHHPTSSPLSTLPAPRCPPTRCATASWSPSSSCRHTRCGRRPRAWPPPAQRPLARTPRMCPWQQSTSRRGRSLRSLECEKLLARQAGQHQYTTTKRGSPVEDDSYILLCGGGPLVRYVAYAFLFTYLPLKVGRLRLDSSYNTGINLGWSHNRK